MTFLNQIRDFFVIAVPVVLLLLWYRPSDMNFAADSLERWQGRIHRVLGYLIFRMRVRARARKVGMTAYRQEKSKMKAHREFNHLFDDKYVEREDKVLTLPDRE